VLRLSTWNVAVVFHMIVLYFRFEQGKRRWKTYTLIIIHEPFIICNDIFINKQYYNIYTQFYFNADNAVQRGIPCNFYIRII